MKPIPRCDGYFACANGHVYSIWKSGNGGKGKVLKKLRPSLSSNKRYFHVNVLEDGKRVTRDTHILVARAFHGERIGKETVSHLDGNSKNNKKCNLKYESASANLKRKIEHGTHDRGLNNSRAAFLQHDITKIFELRKIGLTQKAIANIFGVSRTSVSRVLNKKRYAL